MFISRPEDPYLVADYPELKTVGTIHGLDRVYRLIADIDAAPSRSEDGDSGFVPIGNPPAPFAGAFHGGGHVIRNLTINRPNTDDVGLFGRASGATIDSLTLRNASVTGRTAVGALAGTDSAAIRYCSVSGTVNGHALVGGLLGNSRGGSAIRLSYTCAVSGRDSSIGGLVGGTDVGALTFADTAANRTVSVLMYRVGEIRGIDTLWGNQARSLITLDTVVLSVPAGEHVSGSFALEQNYPNPFNPSTTIRYALPRKATVLLTIFNAIGQRVASLDQGEKPAGYHEIRFDATGLSSGVDFYRLQAGDHAATKKLLLLR